MIVDWGFMSLSAAKAISWQKNMLKTYALVMLTDATETKAYKSGVQEPWCAIYKINDDGALEPD